MPGDVITLRRAPRFPTWSQGSVSRHGVLAAFVAPWRDVAFGGWRGRCPARGKESVGVSAPGPWCCGAAGGGRGGSAWLQGRGCPGAAPGLPQFWGRAHWRLRRCSVSCTCPLPTGAPSVVRQRRLGAGSWSLERGSAVHLARRVGRRKTRGGFNATKRHPTFHV